MVETISLEELLGYLGKFEDTVNEQCLDILKGHAPIGLTGNLLENTKILSQGKGYCTIGVDRTKVPYIDAVINGRGPVYPDPDKIKADPRHSLQYVEYEGSGSSIHTTERGKLKAAPGEVVSSKYFGPAEGNDFVTEAVQDILSADIDIKNGITKWAKPIYQAARKARNAAKNFFRNLWSR